MSDDIKLVPLKDCITKDLYEMYKDIPKEELGSLNPLNNVSFDEFKKICNNYLKEEKEINKSINTTTSRYILFCNKDLLERLE